MKIITHNVPTNIKWRERGELRILEEAVTLSCQVADEGRKGWLRLDLPAGWTTDGASVPKAFRCFAGHPFEHELQLGFMWHDALYATHYQSRAFSDALYEACLEWAGVSWWKRKMHYRALRVGGHDAWADESLNDIAASRKAIGWMEEWMGK